LRQSCSWEYLFGRLRVINVGRCIGLPSSPHGGVPDQLTNHRAFLINGKRHQENRCGLSRYYYLELIEAAILLCAASALGILWLSCISRWLCDTVILSFQEPQLAVPCATHTQISDCYTASPSKLCFCHNLQAMRIS
jgi:hypothetical protein